MNKLLVTLPIALFALVVGVSQSQAESPRTTGSGSPKVESTTNAPLNTDIQFRNQQTGQQNTPSQGGMGLDTRDKSQITSNLYPNLIRRSPVPNSGNQCFVDTMLDPTTHKEITSQVGINCKT